nr:fimbrial protein [Enterobacter chengduensis]
MVSGIVSPVFAACHITSGNSGDGVVVFQMPAVITVDPDTPVGTVIYEHSVESNGVTFYCDSTKTWLREGYIAFTDADARYGVLEGVYQTNVPGIGFRAAASTEQFPSYTTENLITPFHNVGMIDNWTEDTMTFRAIAQLVVTGTVEEGYLDTSRLVSRTTMGDVVVGEMNFAPASVHIVTKTNTCNLVDKNIYVPLKTINVSDINGKLSDILTDGSFKIELTDCTAGTQVDYQFTSSGSTGVTNDNILNIASGDQAASGVGLQILDKNNTVLNFDQNYTAISSASDKVPVEIPLKARYIKTGQVKAGKVNSVATFEVYYR